MRIFLKLYMLSCLIKLERFECLKYFGRMEEHKTYLSLMMKDCPASVHSKHCGSYLASKMSHSFYTNRGTDAFFGFRFIIFMPFYYRRVKIPLRLNCDGPEQPENSIPTTVDTSYFLNLFIICFDLSSRYAFSPLLTAGS